MKHSDPYALLSSPRDLVRRDSLRPPLWVIGRMLGKAPQRSTTDPTAWTNHTLTFGPVRTRESLTHRLFSFNFV